MSFEPDAVRAFEHAGWQRAAARYTGTFAHATAPFVAPLLEAAGVSADKRVLDVACGPGHVAAAAAARGAAAQGLDFSAAMVGIARNTYPGIAVTEGDAEDLPYADGAFDAVVSGLRHSPRAPARGGACRVQARAQTGRTRCVHGVGRACGQHGLVARVRRGGAPRQSRPRMHRRPEED